MKIGLRVPCSPGARAVAPLRHLLPFALAAAAQAAAADPAPGAHRFRLATADGVRSYLVHVPAQAARGEVLPVVLNFHGGGSNAEQHRRYTGMDRAADAHGFIAVYPDGSGRRTDRLLTWNAGHCCGHALAEAVDDVAFVAALLDDLARRLPFDTGRVYATGLSNGAMMAYRLAERLPGRIAAIAPVAGTGRPVRGLDGRPMPLLHIHSADDPRAFYAGGRGPYNFATGEHIVHFPVEATVAAWAARAGCAETPRTEWTRHGRGADRGHRATYLRFVDCRDGAEVALLRLAGPGHVWPGGHGGVLSRRVLGTPSTVIDANEEIWRFVSRYRLP